MALRSIQLRWHGRCCRCHGELAAGELALWDGVTHEVACLVCPDPVEAAPPVVPAPTAAPPRPVRSGAEQARVRRLIDEAREALRHAREAG